MELGIKPPQTLASGEQCGRCQTELFGNLAVRSAVIGGISVIGIVEDGARNWILCDDCNRLLCHRCAPHHQTGCCDDCLQKRQAEFYRSGRLE